jgi:hypothetical protein
VVCACGRGASGNSGVCPGVDWQGRRGTVLRAQGARIEWRHPVIPQPASTRPGPSAPHRTANQCPGCTRRQCVNTCLFLDCRPDVYAPACVCLSPVREFSRLALVETLTERWLREEWPHALPVPLAKSQMGLKRDRCWVCPAALSAMSSSGMDARPSASLLAFHSTSCRHVIASRAAPPPPYPYVTGCYRSHGSTRPAIQHYAYLWGGGVGLVVRPSGRSCCLASAATVAPHCRFCAHCHDGCLLGSVSSGVRARCEPLRARHVVWRDAVPGGMWCPASSCTSWACSYGWPSPPRCSCWPLCCCLCPAPFAEARSWWLTNSWVFPCSTLPPTESLSSTSSSRWRP